jgi:serine/threonine-protein kinase
MLDRLSTVADWIDIEARACGLWHFLGPYAPPPASFASRRILSYLADVSLLEGTVMATLVGQTVSHYRILEHLGGGGMGVVYKAQDLKLDRPVALKFLPPELTLDPVTKQRFVLEAKAASALQHNNICVVHDIDETSDGKLFISMEYLEGETLKQKIERGPSEIGPVIDIVSQIAKGLAKAHEHGIVHRDVKPANIIITKDSVVKIVDFGLAKLSGRTMLTKTGSTLGTAAYMSPEQARGENVDHRTDIWSLGVVLYEMIAGRRPFDSDYEQALTYQIISTQPEPLSKIRPEISTGLAQIVGHAMAKEAPERYQTMELLLADLTAVAAGLRPVTAKPRAAAVKLAVLPLVNLTGDPDQEYLSDGLTQEMIAQLGRLNPQSLSVIARTSVMRYKKTDVPIDQIGRELAVDYVLEGSAQREGSRVRVIAELIQVPNQMQLWTDIFEREMSGILTLQNALAMQVAKALAIELLPAEQVRLATVRTVDPEAYRAYLKASQTYIKLTPEDLETAERYCMLAMQKCPEFAPAYAIQSLIWACRQQLGLTRPGEAGPKAKAAALKAIELDESNSDAHYALATVLSWTEWNFEAAEPEWRRAIELDPGNAEAMAMASHALMIMRRPEEAMELIERALLSDPYSVIVTSFYAVDLLLIRRYDEAIAAAQTALRVQPGAPLALTALWCAYVMKPMPQLEALDAAKRVLMACYGDQSLVTALEEGFAEVGYQAGMKCAAEALARRFESSVALPTDVSYFYMVAGDNGKALEWLERAFEVRDPSMPYVGLWPLYDPIRDEPRFQNLMRQIGMPKQEM